MTKKSKREFIVSAYAVSPYKGSEPGLGWNFIIEMSKFDIILHVITEKNEFENDIIKIKDKLPNNVFFYFIPRIFSQKKFKIFGRAYYYYSYRNWQKSAYNEAKKIISIRNITAVHQLNMIGYREPGFLWKLDLPFIYGPFGGMQNAPYSLVKSHSLKGIYTLISRTLINKLQFKYSKRCYKAALKAYEFNSLYTNPFLVDQINDNWNIKPKPIFEQGVRFLPDNSLDKITKPSLSNFTIVWVGTLTYNKSLNILLEAIQNFKIPIKLNIVGDGPCMQYYKAIAKKIDTKCEIVWHGWLDRKITLQIIKSSHIMVFTSLKEGIPTVIFEALYNETPVITLNHHGQGYIVNNNCGILIEIESFEKTVDNFRKSIYRLATNEEIYKKLKKGTTKRINDFKWDDIVEKVKVIYDQF